MDEGTRSADPAMGRRQQRGRPRNAETDRVILAATCEILIAHGYGRLSMEAVAARSCIGKPALYRRWSSKPALVADAVVANLSIDSPSAETITIPDSGEVGRDLHGWLDGFASVATDPRNAALSLALIAAAAENPDDAEMLYGLLTGPTHQALTVRLRVAATEGQIRPDADLEGIGDALIGSIVILLLTGRAKATPQRAHDLLEIILRGLRPSASV